jgi:hypothetical protein
VASLVLVPGTARGLADLGSLTVERRLRLGRPAAAALMALGALLFVHGVSGPAVELHGYPVAALAWMDRNDLMGEGARVVAEDFVGNYREALEGPHAGVFIDDRYDMYPEAVVDDYLVLKRGRPGWDAVLRTWGATAVVWNRELPLAQLLAVSDGWRVVHEDARWVVAVPA